MTVHTELNYYEVLCVSTSASQSEIKRAYRKCARKYHPDRQVSKTEEERREAQAQWTRISEAYDTLSDLLRKTFYDIDLGLVEESGFENERLYHEQLQQATLAVENMQERYRRVVNKETERDGIIVVEAQYGVLHSLPEHEMTKQQLHKLDEVRDQLSLDVKHAVQCLVDPDGYVHYPARHSKSLIEGFCDPGLLLIARNIMEEGSFRRHLDIRYIFRNTMHRVRVEDSEELRMPLQKHSLVVAEKNSKTPNLDDITLAMRRAAGRATRNAERRRGGGRRRAGRGDESQSRWSWPSRTTLTRGVVAASWLSFVAVVAVRLARQYDISWRNVMKAGVIATPTAEAPTLPVTSVVPSAAVPSAAAMAQAVPATALTSHGIILVQKPM